MKNYVVMFRLINRDTDNAFRRGIQLSFPDFTIEKVENYEFIAFRSRQLPAVVDKIDSLIEDLTLSSKDFIALFYRKEDEPDVIKRLMLVGPSRFVENENQKLHISQSAMDLILTDLLNFRFELIRQ